MDDYRNTVALVGGGPQWVKVHPKIENIMTSVSFLIKINFLSVAQICLHIF